MLPLTRAHGLKSAETRDVRGGFERIRFGICRLEAGALAFKSA